MKSLSLAVVMGLLASSLGWAQASEIIVDGKDVSYVSKEFVCVNAENIALENGKSVLALISDLHRKEYAWEDEVVCQGTSRFRVHSYNPETAEVDELKIDLEVACTSEKALRAHRKEVMGELIKTLQSVGYQVGKCRPALKFGR